MECITQHYHHNLYRIIPHQTSSLTYSRPHRIPRHTIIPPHHITHFILHSASRSTLFHFAIPYFKIAPYWPHYASRRISHCTRHFTLLTYRLTLHSMYTPRHIERIPIGHVIDQHSTTTYRITPHFHTTLHRGISHVPHLASFHHI